MPDINFISNFHDTFDKEQLINYCNEYVSLYGYPCILRHWNKGYSSTLDSLYMDSLSHLELNKKTDLFTDINTTVVVDYQRFTNVLKSYGMSLQNDASLDGMMKLEDKPLEDDIIQILYPYDNKYYSFKLGSVEEHKDICYKVTLNVYYQDVLTESVFDINEPIDCTKLKQVQINNADDEIIKI